ncbi:hypothetical protein MHYP_G00214400 [Metynnis hypsauchen]
MEQSEQGLVEGVMNLQDHHQVQQSPFWKDKTREWRAPEPWPKILQVNDWRTFTTVQLCMAEVDNKREMESTEHVNMGDGASAVAVVKAGALQRSHRGLHVLEHRRVFSAVRAGQPNGLQLSENGPLLSAGGAHGHSYTRHVDRKETAFLLSLQPHRIKNKTAEHRRPPIRELEIQITLKHLCVCRAE